MELERQIDFEAARPEEFFESLPSRPAVVLIEPHENLKGARPVLIRTTDLARRMRVLLGEPEPGSKRVKPLVRCSEPSPLWTSRRVFTPVPRSTTSSWSNFRMWNFRSSATVDSYRPLTVIA